ncbi:hypothetical protein Goshw_000181 [Gossypium schwendimanii]|uniref:Uncharacterized protein n=1 Tax=Gossypium schwendimanii TaxID=34291 RepID=A0A7J9KIM9_GOSSC|nr:hypothetical protein [Gossypium schwendimanii]
MVVFVYLEKPLVSQILTIGKLQRVEFESLLAIRFSYGCYGHLKDVYLYNGSDLNSVAGNPHIPLPKAMSASATIISSQTVAEVDKFDKCHDGHISGVRLEEIS